jgi:hypothetical protein
MTQQQRRIEEQQPPWAATTDPDILEAAPAPQRVRLIAGADVQDMELAGRRVADARALAMALFGIHPTAIAVVGDRRVGDDHVLEAGQVLEFVKHAGQKGAGGAAARTRSTAPTIELVGDRAVWSSNGREMGVTPVRMLLDRVAAAGQPPETWRIVPLHVRLMVERAGGDITGVVIEMPPGPRVVRWIADGSPKDYGPGTRYENRRLSFPWVVLVVVFAGGELTGMQQAFFRTAPIASLDDELYFTCLPNCARAPAYKDQESWVCLANLARRLERLSWNERLKAVTDHMFYGAFNRSSEVHEGNSYWGSAGDIDPRLKTVAAWEAATAENPYFTLKVWWRRAPEPVGATLARMLDAVTPWHAVEHVDQLVTLMQQQL